MLSGQRKYRKPSTIYLLQSTHTNSASKPGNFKYDLHKRTFHLLQNFREWNISLNLTYTFTTSTIVSRLPAKYSKYVGNSTPEMSHFLPNNRTKCPRKTSGTAEFKVESQ